MQSKVFCCFFNWWGQKLSFLYISTAQGIHHKYLMYASTSSPNWKKKSFAHHTYRLLLTIFLLLGNSKSAIHSHINCSGEASHKTTLLYNSFYMKFKNMQNDRIMVVGFDRVGSRGTGLQGVQRSSLGVGYILYIYWSGWWWHQIVHLAWAFYSVIALNWGIYF